MAIVLLGKNYWLFCHASNIATNRPDSHAIRRGFCGRDTNHSLSKWHLSQKLKYKQAHQNIVTVLLTLPLPGTWNKELVVPPISVSFKTCAPHRQLLHLLWNINNLAQLAFPLVCHHKLRLQYLFKPQTFAEIHTNDQKNDECTVTSTFVNDEYSPSSCLARSTAGNAGFT